jgi:macrolide transport system ATP-binding/permease protein
MLIDLKRVSKTYIMGTTPVHALKDVSISIEEGDFVAIMGPSGSGKSTLMHILGLLDVPGGGTYELNGETISGYSEDELAALRRKAVGFVFQQFNLLSRTSALDNVALPLLYSERKIDYERAKELLERVGLGNRLDHHPNEMSGGQQQRVAIARSLVNRPMLILADEPTGNLDSKSEVEILNLLTELNDSGITVIIVTHEEEVGQRAKRVIRMRDGLVQSDERLRPLKLDSARAAMPKRIEAKSESFEFAHVEQYFEMGFKHLSANKVRTALSMLGILIGVAAVVAMLALGRGAREAVEHQLSSLGSNLLTIRSGAGRGAGGARAESGTVARLTLEDVDSIKTQIENVKAVSASVSGRAQATFENENWNTNVIGAEPSYAQMHNLVPESGRFLNSQENQTRNRVAVVGATVVRELFHGKNPVGEMIKLNKVSFQVIGVIPEKGSGGYMDQDDKIIIPVNTAMKRLFGKTYVDAIEVEMNSSEAATEAQDQLLDLMYKRHNVPLSAQNEAFNVMNMAEIQAALSSSTQIMTLLLSIIAAISLVVGGVGIMNIMLVSVTERTREIGLRKAIGGARRDILSQFLAEAIMISAIGGSMGIILAWITTVLLAYFSGWATSISAGSVLVSFLFSASVGVIFGYYPARKASLLQPIEALRYD